MEKVFDAVAEVIMQHGLMGVVVATLLYALHWLSSKYHDAQEARVEGAKDFVKAVNDNTQAIRELRDEVINRRDNGK